MMPVCIIVIFIFFRFFGIALFPVLDDDLLFSRTQIDRATLDERIIELLYIVTGDIFLATSCEMSFDDVREGVDEDIEWFFIISTMTCFFVLGRILEELHELTRIASAPQ
jgi:hypothetical protein